MDFQGLTDEEILEQLKQCSNDQLLAKLQNITDAHLLERIGKKLSYSQLLFLFHSLKSPSFLAPLLMGIGPAHFEALLENDLSRLKLLSQEEPLQHQLTLFSHRIEKELETIAHALKQIEKKNTWEEIPPIQNRCKRIDDALQKALSLAWSTPREDLVSMLSQLKETSLKIQADWIGEKRSPTSPPSGLYQKWEAACSKEAGFHLLNDEDPSVEGLAGLSLWSHEDYHDLRVVPKGEEVDPAKVQAALNLLGLQTVADLKRLNLFSKQAVQKFLQRRL